MTNFNCKLILKHFHKGRASNNGLFNVKALLKTVGKNAMRKQLISFDDKWIDAGYVCLHKLHITEE